MNWSDINRKPTDRTLRRFAVLWLVFFGGLAGWQAGVRERAVLGVALAALAVVVGGIGLVKPQALRWLFVSWTVAAFPMGWIMSHVLLASLFYGVFTPLGLVFRLIGRDALHRRWREDQTTYWMPKPTAGDVRGYFRQF